MAGLFGFFDYSKPGPGISNDEPQKYSFFVFFDIFFRKFWDLIKINIIYFFSCLPFFILTILASYYFKNFILAYLFAFLAFATIGPATSGFTFIMRNFAREEHAFLWMDYKDTIKKNWKQSLAISFINSLAFIIMVISVYFYYINSANNFWYIIPMGVGITCLVIFTFMQYYLYVMVITFTLKLKQLYKNAFIFALAGFLRNIFITVAILITLLITYILFVLFPLSLLLVLFISLSFLGLLINRSVWGQIKKLMIDPYNKENGINIDENKEAPLFKDKGREKQKKKFIK